jgi:hypothetical protein
MESKFANQNLNQEKVCWITLIKVEFISHQQPMFVGIDDNPWWEIDKANGPVLMIY